MTRIPDCVKMPGRISVFTEKQKNVINWIENKCNAEVIVVCDEPDLPGLSASYAAFLSRPEEFTGEQEIRSRYQRFFRIRIPWPEMNGELSYLRDDPEEKMMSEAERKRYPEIIRREIPSETTFSKLDSCNILTSRRYGWSIDPLLDEMREFTALLELGWHLGREADFDDPFIPDIEPRSEEDLIWEEILEERRAAVEVECSCFA